MAVKAEAFRSPVCAHPARDDLNGDRCLLAGTGNSRGDNPGLSRPPTPRSAAALGAFHPGGRGPGLTRRINPTPLGFIRQINPPTIDLFVGEKFSEIVHWNFYRLQVKQLFHDDEHVATWVDDPDFAGGG